MATFVKKEAIDFGWTTVKSNLKSLLIFAIVLILLYGIPQAIESFITEQIKQSPNNPSLHILSFVLMIAVYILDLVLSIGVIRYSLKFVDGKKGEISDLFATNTKEVWHYWLASALYGLRVLLGFILLIVPGIIWSIKYSQYKYLVIDKGMTPSSSIKKSAEITEGNKMNLFLFSALLGLINIAGAIALLVGLFVTIPLTLIAQAYVYRKLVSTNSTLDTSHEEKPKIIAPSTNPK